MTRKDSNRSIAEIKAMMAEDGRFLRPMVRSVIQEFLKPKWHRRWSPKKESGLKGA